MTMVSKWSGTACLCCLIWLVGCTQKTSTIRDDNRNALAEASPQPGKSRSVRVNERSEAKSTPNRDGVGFLEPSAIGRVVNNGKGAIKACYDTQLKFNPTLEGRVRVEFTILESGQVDRVQLLEDLPTNKRVGICIIEKMQLWQFPKPKGGRVTVSFPFIFKPSQAKLQTKAKPSP